MAQAAELLRAIDDGIVDAGHVRAEIGQVLAGTATGRSSDVAVTVYKSVGVASQDIVTSRRIYERALAKGAGKKVSM